MDALKIRKERGPITPDPSQEDIKRLCLEIESIWSERTRLHRAGYFEQRLVEVDGLPERDLAG